MNNTDSDRDLPPLRANYEDGEPLVADDINKIAKYITDLKFSVDKLKLDYEDQERQLKKQKQEIDNLQRKIASLKEELTTSSNKNQEEISKLHTQVEVLQEQLQTLESQPRKERSVLQCGHGVELHLSLMPSGQFFMGSNSGNSSEKPVHLVTVSSFYMAKYPITQAQYQAVTGSNPSKFSSKDNHPVESVTWEEARQFCQLLSAKTQEIVCLPSEAQWEYACRAGSSSDYYFGDQEAQLSNYGWYGESVETGSTHPVGMKSPNPWGLFDLYGNVWEWCEDEWHYNYHNAPDTCIAWQDNNINGVLRVARGGSWVSTADSCGSAYRERYPALIRDFSIGFRVIVKV